MKKFLILCFVALAIRAAVVTKTSGKMPRYDQTCALNDSTPLKSNWFWDSSRGHCEYCYEHCPTCSESYYTCSTCESTYGIYESDTTDHTGNKRKICKICGEGLDGRVQSCCWIDSSHPYGFHAALNGCSSDSVQFGHYCMKGLTGCQQYSANTRSSNKDSAGYTRCHQCADGYYLTPNYECSPCTHMTFQSLVDLDPKLIPKEIDNKPEIFTFSDIESSGDNTCKTCNGRGQCRECKRGFFMATNYHRQTYDKNIARNPSTCRKCKDQDEIHTAGSNACACTCSIANNRCTSCEHGSGTANMCWQDKNKDFACRPCGEITYERSDNVVVNIGNNCKLCQDNGDHDDDQLNQNKSCIECVDGAFPLPFWNPARETKYGYLCVDPRAQTYGSPFTGNPGLNGDDSSSSPSDRQIHYENKDSIQSNKITRVSHFIPAGASESTLRTIFTQKEHMTIPDCYSAEYLTVSNYEGGGTAKYVVYYPTCNKCDNGYAPYVLSNVKFTEDVTVGDTTTTQTYYPVNITVCRKCSDVIKERDDEFLGSTHDNYKWVRRCETEDQDAKKYKITQCAYSSDHSIDNYPSSTSTDVENTNRGQANWDKFVGHPNDSSTDYRSLETLYYLVSNTSSTSYSNMTWCIKNTNKCRKIKAYETSTAGDEGLKEAYTKTKSQALCEDCYTDAGTTSKIMSGTLVYHLVETKICVACSTDNANIGEGCTACKAVVTDAGTSANIMCIECANGQEHQYYPNYSGEAWNWDYNTTTITKNYATTTDSDTGAKTCTKCNDYCKTCSSTTLGNCDECQPFFYLDEDNATCSKCYIKSNTETTQHCKTCKEGPTKCTECMDGYQLYTLSRSDLKICEKCEDNCTKCHTTTTGRKQCRSCNSGYYLQDGVCHLKRRGCTNDFSTTSGDCNKCQYGYTLINGGWCYDCVRQQYTADNTPDQGGSAYNYDSVHGFIFCNWDTSCVESTHVEQYTNVRRPASGTRRILDLLDEIFE